MPRPVSHVLSNAPSSASEAERLIALEQEQYMTLPAIVGQAPTYPITSRWTFTPEERSQIAAGGDIWITLLTFGGGQQPILIRSEEPTLAECLRVEV